MRRPYNSRSQNRFQILDFQHKFQIINLFRHSFHTITGNYHEQLAILPISVNLAVPRIAIIVKSQDWEIIRIPDSYDSYDKWEPGFSVKHELLPVFWDTVKSCLFSVLAPL